MANYYWVGGNATWDATAGSKWATTSGGTTYYSTPPTSSDVVYINAASGSVTVTIGSGTAICSGLIMTGFTGVLAFGTNSIEIAGTGIIYGQCYIGDTTYSITGTPVINFTYSGSVSRLVYPGNVTEANAISLNVTAGTGFYSIAGNVKNLNYTGYSGQCLDSAFTIYGNLTCSSTMSWAGGTNTITFAATSGTQVITTNGKAPQQNISINGVGTTVQLADDYTNVVTWSLYISNGTFDANNKNVTFASVVLGVGTKTLIMGSGTWTLAGTGYVWNMYANNSGLTFSGASAPIVLSDTSTTARTFVTGTSLSYNSLTIGGTTGTSTLTISGTGSTFTTIASTKTVAHTIQIGSSIFVSNWTAKGTAGNVLTINNGTITKNGGGVISNLNYLSIQGSTVAPASTWYAGSNSTDAGFNSGWIFSGNYADTVTENAGLTDVKTTTWAATANVVENTTLTDNPIGKWNTSAAITETVTVLDSPTGFWVTNSVITELMTLADTYINNTAFASAISENAGLTDIKTTTWNALANTTENITVQESANPTLIYNVSNIENINFESLKNNFKIN